MHTFQKFLMKYWEVALKWRVMDFIGLNELQSWNLWCQTDPKQGTNTRWITSKLKLMFVRFSKPRHLITVTSSSFPEKHAIYYAIYIIYIYISTPYISNVLRSCRSVRYIMLAKPTIYWDFMNSLFLFWNYELNIESTDESFITSTWKKHPLKNCRMKYLSEIIINK